MRRARTHRKQHLIEFSPGTLSPIQVKLLEEKKEAEQPRLDMAASNAQKADEEASKARDEEVAAVKAAAEAEERASEAIRTLEERSAAGGDDEEELREAMQALLAEKAKAEQAAAKAMRARAHAEQKADEERRRLNAALKAGEEALAKAMAAQKAAEESAEAAFAKENAARSDPHTDTTFDWKKGRPKFDAKRFAKGIERARCLKEAKEKELAQQQADAAKATGGSGRGKGGGGALHGPLSALDVGGVVDRLKQVVGEQEDWAKQKSNGGAPTNARDRLRRRLLLCCYPCDRVRPQLPSTAETQLATPAGGRKCCLLTYTAGFDPRRTPAGRLRPLLRPANRRLCCDRLCAEFERKEDLDVIEACCDRLVRLCSGNKKNRKAAAAAGVFAELNKVHKKFIGIANSSETKGEPEARIVFRQRLLVTHVKANTAIAAVAKKAEGEGVQGEASKCVHGLTDAVKLVTRHTMDTVHRVTRNNEQNTMKLMRSGGEREWLDPKSNVFVPDPEAPTGTSRRGV